MEGSGRSLLIIPKPPLVKIFYKRENKQRGGMTSKMGRAEVQIISSFSTVCIFQEMGYWLKDQMLETTFHRSFR